MLSAGDRENLDTCIRHIDALYRGIEDRVEWDDCTPVKASEIGEVLGRITAAVLLLKGVRNEGS